MNHQLSVFISVGNCTYMFHRIFELAGSLLKTLSSNHFLNVYVQSGGNDVEFLRKNNTFGSLEVKDFYSKEEFDELVSECDIFISHCGVGSVLKRLECGRKPITLARNKKRKEHIDNHQEELQSRLLEHSYAVDLNDVIDNGLDIEKLNLNFPIEMVPIKFNLPNKNFVAVSSVGGHKVALEKIISTHADKYDFHCYTDEDCSDTLNGTFQKFPSCGKKYMLPIRVLQAAKCISKYPGAPIVTTGAGVGLAFAIAGKILGRYVIAQESLTRISKPSLWFLFSSKIANLTVASPWASFNSDMSFSLKEKEGSHEK